MQFQKISIPPPQRINENSKGDGVAKKKTNFKEKYGAKLEFLEGWVGGWISSETTQ